MFVAGTAAALFGLLLLTAPALKHFFSDRISPRISFEQGQTLRQRVGAAQKPKPAATTIFDGEVYRTEGRLREASAVELVPNRTLLTSEHSQIHVRLRTEPFAVEVLSLGRERLNGPALLLRVPDYARSKNEPARYFFSLNLEDVKAPAPFANPSAVLACGWQMDTIRPSMPEGANENQLAAWASEQQSK
jgi:hypothetical protein